MNVVCGPWGARRSTPSSTAHPKSPAAVLSHATSQTPASALPTLCWWTHHSLRRSETIGQGGMDRDRRISRAGNARGAQDAHPASLALAALSARQRRPCKFPTRSRKTVFLIGSLHCPRFRWVTFNRGRRQARVGRKNKITRWAGPGHLRRATTGLRRPLFSVQSVRPKERARPALMRQRGPCNLNRGRARRACHPSPRSGGMACLEEASHPGQPRVAPAPA
jgi:hypothetical protein